MENSFIFNGYPLVRIELLSKGWYEFGQSSNRESLEQSKNTGPKDSATVETDNEALKSTIFPRFIWVLGRDRIDFNSLHPEQIVNHLPEAIFSTKIGLCQCLQDVHWLEDVDSDNFFPRCYRIGVPLENKTFVEDFRLTCCINILKWLVDYLPSYCVYDLSPTENSVVIPVRAIDALLKHCELFIKTKQNQTINLNETPYLTDNDWLFITEWYHQLMNQSVQIRNAMSFYKPCVSMLKRMAIHWPQLLMDGKQNLWIVKPAAKARGQGIRIVQNIKDILIMSVDKSSDKGVTHVVQKYIERPLLIAGTKFDIRQWFLVTIFDVLTIYVYQDCYIRFCSKPFSLQDNNEAVHLCNNSVQRRYINFKRKLDLIPNELMWSLDQLKQYLENEGMLDVWDSYIYPTMKNAIITTVQSAYVGYQFRQNCFELFGADFLLSEDYHPWLLEINSDPSLAPSTNVTAKLCSSVISDTLKVVLDRRNDPECSIGRFECVYKQPSIPSREFVGISLKLNGIINPKPVLNPLNRFSPRTYLPQLYLNDLQAKNTETTFDLLTPLSSENRQSELENDLAETLII